MIHLYYISILIITIIKGIEILSSHQTQDTKHVQEPHATSSLLHSDTMEIPRVL